MWHQEMFNPHCRETKGCFNPTVRGEGGSWEGRGSRGGGFVRVCRRGGERLLRGNRLLSPHYHSVTADTSRSTQPLGLWRVNRALTRRMHVLRGFTLVDAHTRIKGEVILSADKYFTPCSHPLRSESSACDALQVKSNLLADSTTETINTLKHKGFFSPVKFISFDLIFLYLGYGLLLVKQNNTFDRVELSGQNVVYK